MKWYSYPACMNQHILPNIFSSSSDVFCWEKQLAIVHHKGCHPVNVCVMFLCSSLEDCLVAQGCTGVEILRRELEKTAAKLQGAQAYQGHLKAELACLKER